MGQCHGALRRRPAGTYLTSYVRRSKARITESNPGPYWSEYLISGMRCESLEGLGSDVADVADVAATGYASLMVMSLSQASGSWTRKKKG